jgi:hypothetical protein
MTRFGKIGVFVLAMTGVLAGVYPAQAVAAGPPDNGNFPVSLAAGEVFDVCKSGTIVCPARSPICDDPKVATPTDLPDGLGFKGVSPGTTLCSAASAVGPRRVYRITVR